MAELDGRGLLFFVSGRHFPIGQNEIAETTIWVAGWRFFGFGRSRVFRRALHVSGFPVGLAKEPLRLRVRGIHPQHFFQFAYRIVHMAGSQIGFTKSKPRATAGWIHPDCATVSDGRFGGLSGAVERQALEVNE